MVEMTSREDLMNAVSLNSFRRQRRACPSAHRSAGLSDGARRDGDVFFLNGLASSRLIAGPA